MSSHRHWGNLLLRPWSVHCFLGMILWQPKKLEKVLGQEEENMSSIPGLIINTSGLNFFTYKIVIIFFPKVKSVFEKYKNYAD